MTGDEIKARIEEIPVHYEVTYAGQTKRHNWDCDAWRYKINDIEGDYFTGLGLRKITKSAPKCGLPKNTIGYKQWEDSYLKPVKPHLADILYSLFSEADALDMNFKEWCDNFGYDDDSIKALNIYNQCIDIGYKLRNMFKREIYNELKELLYEY